MNLFFKVNMRGMRLVSALIVVIIVLLNSEKGESRKSKIGNSNWFEYNAINCREHSASLSDYGGVGDGKTSNTKAFEYAMRNLSEYASKGGAQLYVPAGKWLTGSFSLISHFTLYLHKDAVLLASQDMNEWPVIKPLPSYGRGRDAAAGRYTSLIFGTNLTDVIITGDNGTIDGQGAFWWQQFHKKKLKYTRPYLIELLFSENIQISDLTLLNSPSWHVHPTYSSNIIIKGITINAPVTSPNTDGINPDSCTNTRIEDCYIVSGDDCVAVKSGWDEYGIKFESGVRIKTAVGRGGYVKDIYVKRMYLHTMKWAFWMTGNYGSHADSHYDPNALPEIKGINYRDVVAENVNMAARLEGISKDPFTGICMANVTIGMAAKHKKQIWTCTDIEGVTSGVTPQPCDLLPDQGSKKITACDFPPENIPIDMVELKKCSYTLKHA
ncbi:hypothetical protein PIB30_054052 [Stylosanthes scabra]|uniref:Polygalacturonase n=1 Tax=Stylosanthes scabra TaxID=79078 RepID=A0ABU6TIE0_9FABA|nr:hypothetical protein [Stylosanthes scabra]